MLKLSRQLVQPFDGRGVHEQLGSSTLDLAFCMGDFTQLQGVGIFGQTQSEHCLFILATELRFGLTQACQLRLDNQQARIERGRFHFNLCAAPG